VAADLNQPDAALRQFLTGLPGPVSFRETDVRDGPAVSALVADCAPDAAVHGAAITAIPPEAERARFLATVEVNVNGTLHALEALRERRGRIVVVSSGSVYGPRPDLAPIAEGDPKNPQGVYPLTKWAADALARRFAEVHGLDLAVVRLASPFGPFERDTGSRPLLSPVCQWARAALHGETVQASGAPTLARDAIYAADVASGIAAVLLAPTLDHDAYNVGWGRLATAAETLETLRRLVPGFRFEFSPEATSPWGPPRGPLDCARLRALGWTPRHDLESGLAAYLRGPDLGAPR
jgi:nucleoside-diphosphate-sugar epimerase